MVSFVSENGYSKAATVQEIPFVQIEHTILYLHYF